MRRRPAAEPDRLYDPGLQPERTELAWRRTALAIAVGSLISLRILPLVLPAGAGTWGLAPGAIGLGTACLLWFAARRRQRRVTAVLTGAAAGLPPGGGLLLVLTVFGTGFGVVALALVAIALGANSPV
ncbi:MULTISPECIES: DUF202 domain-containing protein [Microbacterium]|uniref:DUF202 domain-containing protein n=1 Tax=Microbacterium TaxID=33882 RepID=UPI00141B6F51|nr:MULTISPECIES: DUF202 domain-containing protein [Microbacterium]MCZ4300289.1 DUF202 domain-containing protein [Microbacterium oxydans]